jgi:CRP-like cAMP-binding protein
MDQKELLNRSYLFTGAKPGDLDALNAIVERKVYVAGDLIFSTGDLADALFFVEMGEVDIMPAGKETVFATIGSGQGFGELSFFEPAGKRSASAFARQNTYVLRIPYEGLSRVLSARQEFALLVYRHACGFFAKHVRMMALDMNHRYL